MENINGVPAVAGWHDDPEDPNFIRYSNGRAWTGERVAKDRTLTLKNDNVYRPGGGIGSIPREESKEESVAEEPAAYQPLTRRERRLLETSEAPELEPMSDLFEDEFEFQSATPVARPYAPTNQPHDETVAAVEEKPEKVEAEPAFFDGFEDAFPKAKKMGNAVPEESDEDEASSLPSLDMGDFVAAPARTKPVEKKVESDDEVSSLPALGEFDSSNALPSLNVRESDVDVDGDVDDDDEDEFFSVSGPVEPVSEDEPAEEEYNFVAVAPEPTERLSYEAPVVQRHSYEPPVAAAPVAEAKEEGSPKADKKVSEATAKETSDYAEEYEFEPKFIDYDAQDEVPTRSPFGFKSKLALPVEKETVADKPTPAAPVLESKPKVEAPSVSEDDDDSEEEGDEQAPKLGGRFKSLFGRSNKEVLDYDYQNNDEDDDVADEAEPLTAPEAPKPVVKSVKAGPVVEDDAADEEEPKLKAGIFSSRQDKEDAAVEVELVDRLNNLARRVAALTKEEAETLARLETAKARETELNALILKAHEEHELLDQLAKGRRKEMDGQQTEKEDDKFLEFLESHDEPVKEAKPEETVALPVVKAKDEEPKDEEPKDENDSSEERLPELKFN